MTDYEELFRELGIAPAEGIFEDLGRLYRHYSGVIFSPAQLAESGRIEEIGDLIRSYAKSLPDKEQLQQAVRAFHKAQMWDVGFVQWLEDYMRDVRDLPCRADLTAHLFAAMQCVLDIEYCRHMLQAHERVVYSDCGRLSIKTRDGG